MFTVLAIFFVVVLDFHIWESRHTKLLDIKDFIDTDTVKVLFSPGGAYLFFVVSEGGLLETGALFLTQDRNNSLLPSLCITSIQISVLPISNLIDISQL